MIYKARGPCLSCEEKPRARPRQITLPTRRVPISYVEHLGQAEYARQQAQQRAAMQAYRQSERQRLEMARRRIRPDLYSNEHTPSAQDVQPLPVRQIHVRNPNSVNFGVDGLDVFAEPKASNPNRLRGGGPTASVMKTDNSRQAQSFNIDRGFSNKERKDYYESETQKRKDRLNSLKNYHNAQKRLKGGKKKRAPPTYGELHQTIKSICPHMSRQDLMRHTIAYLPNCQYYVGSGIIDTIKNFLVQHSPITQWVNSFSNQAHRNALFKHR